MLRESMSQALEAYLLAVWGTLRIADLVDISVVSVGVYAVISWFQSARSRLVMSGLATLIALYFAARLLDMHLTLALFQAGITVAVVALVVIFQDEIRRAFERVALAGRFRSRRNAPPQDATLDTIVEAVANLANAKTGALIVLRGQEPLARHLTGGVLLDGRLSEPLLYSIFDSSSAGHDGALIVEDGIASRFAVHLPLSVEIKGNEHFGTRHTAALGLSERCDALVVVVSEERGVISVAENGRLAEMKSIAELKKRIADLKTRVAPPRTSGWLHRMLTRRLGIKVLSVIISIAAWLVVFGYRSETAIRMVDVPIVFSDVPDGWSVDNPKPLQVKVLVAGPQRELEKLEPTDLTVALDASNLRAGPQSATIGSGNVDLPPGFVVRNVEPNVVRFTAERTTLVTLPIQPAVTGKLANEYALDRVVADPESARVVIPLRLRGSLRKLSTEPVDLTGLTRSMSVAKELELPEGATLAPGEPQTVTVRVELELRSSVSE